MKLIDYGIQNDESDYRVHYCLRVGMSYLFPTKSGQEAAQSGGYRKAGAGQPGVKGTTAIGYLVPANPLALRDLIEIEIPEDLIKIAWKRLDGLSGPSLTEEKGRIAEDIGREMRKRGLFEPYIVRNIPNQKEQMRGLDDKGVTFQYKMDLPGGPKYLGGSGYLFIQIQERNLLKLGRDK